MTSFMEVASSLTLGKDERDSAKHKRRVEYKQDLELQIREKHAARQRERLQDMNVNASGYLDPEKRPDRFKPLGGVHWLEQREKKNTDRVRPYHTLFLYDRDQQRLPAEPATPDRKAGAPRTPPTARVRRVARRVHRGTSETRLPRDLSPTIMVTEEHVPVEPLVLRRRRLLDDAASIQYQPATAPGGLGAVDQAYNFYGAHDLTVGGGGGGSIVQPISLPHSDNRPVVVHAQGGGDGYYGPRYNPFEYKAGDTSREYQNMLLITQSEKDRIRRDNEEFHRRLRQELEDEKRKLTDQENEARRRLDDLRKEAEERRREAERERREAERLRKEAASKVPKPEIQPRPTSKKLMLYTDMDAYRLHLIEERKKIEDMLKASKPVKEEWDLKVIRKPPLNIPRTPKSPDKANKDNVNDFNNLKYREYRTRQEFRTVFPDVPVTNKRLEQQQSALLHHQESNLRDTVITKGPPVRTDIPPRRAISRPTWMDREPTPFPHVLRRRDMLYTSHSDGDLDKIRRRNKDREHVLETTVPDGDAALEGLKLRQQRPSSTETLADDTWLRPSSTAEI